MQMEFTSSDVIIIKSYYSCGILALMKSGLFNSNNLSISILAENVVNINLRFR